MVDKIGTEVTEAADWQDKLKGRSQEIFKEIDTDGNSKIDEQELKSALENMGLVLKKKEVKDMMMHADEDGCVFSSGSRSNARNPVVSHASPSHKYCPQ